MNQDMIGKWALILGLLVAVLAVFATNRVSPSNIILTLFILGLVIGFLNITKKETTNFLIATIVLLAVAGSLSALNALGITTVTDYLIDIVNNFTILISSAALVVSIKTVLQIIKR